MTEPQQVAAVLMPNGLPMVWPEYRDNWQARVANAGATILGMYPSKQQAQAACDSYQEKQIREN
jgi:hypothetical protein